MSTRRTLITAALPYANGPLHLGHLAGAYLAADVYARYLRARDGQDHVLFVCGSDEHGVAISIAARKEGVTPQEVIDKYHTLMQDTFSNLGVSFDIYSRTSHEAHHQLAQGFFKHLDANGWLEVRASEQYYDPQAQQFLADRYITGTCPVCAHPRAYGDQCENCGSSLSPDELIDPRSTLTGAAPEKRPTKHWYFPASGKEQEVNGFLRQYVDAHDAELHPDLAPEAVWKGHVLGQCRSWLREGLKPRAITRDLDWGIDVPPDLQQREGVAGKKLYVWFDAPLGYLTATLEKAQHNPNVAPWQQWWLKNDTAHPREVTASDPRIVHFIGKDNIVFHCLIFPAMLWAHGQYAWAEQVPANEFLNLEGQKLSTSRGWAVWAHEYLEDFQHYPLAADMLRYVLLSTLPEQKDADFSWRDFQQRVNSELIGNVGNVVNRVATLLHKNYTRTDYSTFFGPGKTNPFSDQLARDIEPIVIDIKTNLNQFRFKEALQWVMEGFSRVNKFLSDHEPWKQLKTDRNQAVFQLFAARNEIVYLSGFLDYFLPFTSEMICIRLSESYPTVGGHNWGSGDEIPAPEPLFRKIEDADIAAQLGKLEARRAAAAGGAAAPATAGAPGGPSAEPPTSASPPAEGAPGAPPPPPKPDIAYDLFQQLDLRAATITAAERVPKADKLLKLSLTDGHGTRTVVSGIAEQFAPEALIGQRVVIVANLAPRTLRGVTSQGMILLAEDALGQLSFIDPGPHAPDGSVVR